MPSDGREEDMSSHQTQDDQLHGQLTTETIYRHRFASERNRRRRFVLRAVTRASLGSVTWSHVSGRLASAAE